MMAETAGAKGRSVVVHLGSGAANRLALEAAARLARAFEAEFEGLFVEDDELLSLAGLPFAREISATGRRSRPLSASDVHREMRARSDALHREIERLARSGNLQWRCSVVRDAPAAALRQASKRARILVLGEPLGGTDRHRLPALAACLETVEGCMVVGARVRRATGPVMIALDTIAALEPMAKLAERWAVEPEDQVLLLVLGQALETRARLVERFNQTFARAANVSVQPVADDQPAPTIADIARRSRAGLLIARHRGLLVPNDAALARLTAALECPLLLHGGGGESFASGQAPESTNSRT